MVLSGVRFERVRLFPIAFVSSIRPHREQFDRPVFPIATSPEGEKFHALEWALDEHRETVFLTVFVAALDTRRRP
jgi:hypothetical protein